MIILSEETVTSGTLINDKRNINGLKSLVTLSVPLLKEQKLNIDYCYEEDDKFSSTNYRMRLLGTLLKSPEVNKKNKKFH